MCYCPLTDTRVALIQRSCGYTLRPTLSINVIQKTIRAIKACSPDCTVAVDNCYGEFTERLEPCHVRIQSWERPQSSSHSPMRMM